MYDLQKANMWKRISAALFDVIMLGIAIVGVALLLTVVLNFDGYVEQKEALELKYMEEYGLDPDMTREDLEALSEEEQKAYQDTVNAANKAIQSDPEFAHVLEMLLGLGLIIITFPVLIGFALLEFVVPLILKNGQTLGIKIFGVALMRIDGVKLSPMLLFARSILGKCTLGTLLPVYGAIMYIFGIYPLLGIVLMAVPLLAQAVLFLATKNHTPIHDLLAQTVAVDMASQLIFDSPEALLDYKKRIHAEEAERRER